MATTSSSCTSTSSAYHSFKVRLAIDVIKEHFGPLVAEVASLLMRSDTLTLPEIYKYFRQHAQERSFTTASTNEIVPIDDPAVVRNCLLVLRRHNILVIDFKPLYRVDDSTDEKVKEQNELSKVLHYSIDVEMALNRLRLPRVLLVAREVVGSFGLSIVEELIVEGQSSVNKLVKLVHELILSQSDHSEEIIELKALPEASLVGKIEKAIEELIQNRLIVEVTQMATGPKIIVASEKEKKRQGADTGNDSGKATKKRKKALSSNGEEEVVGVIGNENPSSGGVLTNAQMESTSTTVKRDVWYTINYDEIFRRLQYKAIVTLATQRINRVGGKVIEIILNESLRFQVPGYSVSQEEQSHPITWNHLLDFISREGCISEKPLKPKKATEVLTNAIDELQRDAVGLITKTTYNNQLSFRVNIRKVISFLQWKVKHSIAVERYGKWSGRIVELLGRHKHLDQHSIGEMAIIPARDARERLYSMYRDKWVDYVEICKRNDYNPSSTYYFWFLDRLKLDASLQESLFMSMLNLRKRKLHELKRDCSWSQSFMTAMALGAGGENSSLEKQKEMEKVNFALDRIDQAIIQTDYTAIVLGRF